MFCLVVRNTRVCGMSDWTSRLRKDRGVQQIGYGVDASLRISEPSEVTDTSTRSILSLNEFITLHHFQSDQLLSGARVFLSVAVEKVSPATNLISLSTEKTFFPHVSFAKFKDCSLFVLRRPRSEYQKRTWPSRISHSYDMQHNFTSI